MQPGLRATEVHGGLRAPAEVSTAGSALNWRQVACEAGRRNRLAPEEHASLAHLVAGNARDHIAAMPSLNLTLVYFTKTSGHAGTHA